jgi:hypothetical protein
MRRTVAVAAILAAVVSPGARAGAEPIAPAPDSPCAADLADAFTQVSGTRTILVCGSTPGGYRWTPFDGPYPSSDRWFSYGPAITLHGQGLRNPEILSGHWTATPQDSSSSCGAEQAAVVSAGEVGAPQVTTGKPGQVLDFQVLPVVFSISLTGNCLWERVA